MCRQKPSKSSLQSYRPLSWLVMEGFLRLMKRRMPTGIGHSNVESRSFALALSIGLLLVPTSEYVQSACRLPKVARLNGRSVAFVVKFKLVARAYPRSDFRVIFFVD